MLVTRLKKAMPTLLKKLGTSLEWKAEKMEGDASTRTYFRIHTKEESFIAMVLAQAGPESLAEEITKTETPITELPFINVHRYLKSHKIPVPELLGYDEKNGVLLLEDFGDRLLLNEVKHVKEDQIEALYKKALFELEKIAALKPNQNCIAFSRRFDEDLYNWEFLHFVQWAMDKHLSTPPKPTDRKLIVSSLENLSQQFMSWELVFCHRDYHSRNLIVFDRDTPKIGIIDFQDALMAPLFYDLASLLRDSYIELDPNLKATLLEHYRLQMKSKGFQNTNSKDEFLQAFDFMGLQRNLKAAGRFCYIHHVKGNSSYLADVPRTLSYVKETLENYEEFRALKKVLLPYLDEICEVCS